MPPRTLTPAVANIDERRNLRLLSTFNPHTLPVPTIIAYEQTDKANTIICHYCNLASICSPTTVNANHAWLAQGKEMTDDGTGALSQAS
ncbi:hypothetical protein E6O75_ATG04625 [Venturia nashicola]|uniref:Uncharacterized protein n=1 Tax=Venturia nashicola TaxID=86259 RepID=A0A4Z1PNW9_9PEZI|nr:hypothetical protein E6O75_ATG04625 [Venturia nashicola]